MIWAYLLTVLSSGFTDANLRPVHRDITLDQSEHIIGSARDVIVVPDEEIIVCDSKEPSVKFYGPEGNLLEVLGRKGDGPGEFQAPVAIATSTDHLYVMDIVSARLSLFDRNNHQFIKSVKVYDGMEIDIRKNRLYLSAPRLESNTSLHIYDLHGTLLESTCEIPSVTLANKAVSSNISFDLDGEGNVFLVHEMDHNILKLSSKGKIDLLKGSLRGYKPPPEKPFTDFHLRQKATAWIKSWTHVSKIEVLEKSNRLVVAKSDYDPVRHYLDLYDLEGNLEQGAIKVGMRLLYADADETLYFLAPSDQDDVVLRSFSLVQH